MATRTVPTANALYSSYMQAAGDLVEAIKTDSRSAIPAEERALANRANAQAALALTQAAVTLHAASKTANGKR